jgi:endonuclease G, mitochondrial
MRLPIFLLSFFYCSFLSADVLSVHCPLGCPNSAGGNDIIFGHVYAASNNPSTKFADWVAYEVNVINFGASPSRNWASDPLLDDSKTLEENDYSKASNTLGVDRGHQAPLASFAGSRYWYELNYLSNITPQSKGLNQGPWRLLEAAVRDASKYRKSVYVITGPLYETEMPKLPNADEPHQIPSAYFKVVYKMNGEAVAFIMGQDIDRKADFCSARVALDSLSGRVGIRSIDLRESASLGLSLGCE